MSRKNPALRPYLETVEKLCQQSSKEKLVALLIALAREESPDTRQDYLASIKKHLTAADSDVPQSAQQDEKSLLDDLQGLRKSILERIASIEDGSYWDDPDYDEDDYYLNSDPNYLSEDQLEELDAFFNEAGNAFLASRLPEAGTLYQALFALTEEINEYGFFSGLEVDVKEAHARYCRTVYQLTKPGKRVQEMGKAMQVNRPRHNFDNLREDEMATFQDVIDAQVGKLPDLEKFLPKWEKYLATQGTTPHRLARLRLEAAYMTKKIPGVQKLARSWKEKQPAGYLAWMEYLVQAEDWQTLSKVAHEALDILPMGDDRQSAAGYLIKAGRNCLDDAFVLQGKREAFRSSTGGPDLLYLLDEANRQKVWQEETAAAISILKQAGGDDYYRKPLLAKLFLMTGNFNSLAELCKEEKVYGWSGGSPGALLFCGVLYCCSKGKQQAPLVQNLLARYGDDGIYFDSYPMHDEPAETTFFKHIVRGLEGFDISDNDFSRHIKTTMENGRKRVEYIVSNKHRKAYERAAQALGAMAEMLVAQGERKKAKELLHDYYSQRFNRFPAFKREVREAIANSPLLTDMGIG